MTRHDRRSFLRLVGASSIGAVATAAAGSASAAPGITSGATYRLTPVHSGKALEVASAGTGDGDNVQQWSWNGGDQQRWVVEELDDGNYRIENVNSGNVLDVPNGDTANGTTIQQWSWHGGDMQRWNIVQNDDGTYRVENVASGNVLDVDSWSTADGADVIDWDWLEGDNQRWNFEELSGGGDGGDGGSGGDDGGGGSDGTGAYFDLSDGFATPSWFDDSVTVHRVTEATRSALADAVQASGPRLVVFETSGTIDLGGSELEVTNDRCWIAGQTAPSPGITLTQGLFQVNANDCVVQHIRSRVGPGDSGNIQGNDSFNSADGTSNNIFDHCTASWGVDECMSVGYDTDRTTFSNCLIYEGLYDPYGDGSDHNYATLVGDGADNVALLGNVWAKTRGRVPRLKSGTRSVVANNVMYFFNEATNMDGDTEASIVGNVYIPQDLEDTAIEDGNAYLEDNVTDPSSTPLTGGTSELSSRPLWPGGFSAMAAGDVESHNLSYAGARPADRTSNDSRIVSEIRNRAGDGYTDSPYDYWIADHEEVGGYPQLPENTHTLNVPSSGLRDWIDQWALSVEDPNASPP
ncbi:RICIN domain-containing protein [Halosimplex salinum]|uniref:RICIN domain-containing protein n=1 Tax=Halosimplex salinum TaxID=1710538 RepID=UPI0013DDE47C|nr:RICIN domain-containing protein [Halosimplex salinum]